MNAPPAALLDLSRLPAPHELRARARALVIVDAAFGGPAMFHWLGDAPNGPLAHWERGGDHGFARFEGDEALVWGFASDSPLTPWAHGMTVWPAVIDPVPDRWRRVLQAEPDEVYRDAITFCFWFDERWRRGPVEAPIEEEPDPEGASQLLDWAVAAEPALAAHIADYHQRPADTTALATLLRATRGEAPLDAVALTALAADADVAAALSSASAMGVETG